MMSWLKNRTRESSDPMPDNVLPPALCAVCGTKPRTPGYPTCSPECGRSYRKPRAGPSTPSGARSPEARPSAPLCEECGVRPKAVDEKNKDAHSPVYFRFCGRTCRNRNAERRARGCLLRDCGKTPCETDYCSKLHSKLAVERGEAKACLFCQELAQARPYEYCSKDCFSKDQKKREAKRADTDPTSSRPHRPRPSTATSADDPVVKPVKPLFTGSRPEAKPQPPGSRSDVRTAKDDKGPPNAVPAPGPAKKGHINLDVGPCEFCRIKPKYVKMYEYCGKECATESRLSQNPYSSSVESFDKMKDDNAPPGRFTRPTLTPSASQKGKGFSKTYSCCGSTLTMPNEEPPPFCPLCSFRAMQREGEDRDLAWQLAQEDDAYDRVHHEVSYQGHPRSPQERSLSRSSSRDSYGEWQRVNAGARLRMDEDDDEPYQESTRMTALPEYTPLPNPP